MTQERIESSDGHVNPRPPRVRPLVIAVLVSVLAGIAVAVATLVRFDELVAAAHAADPARPAGSAASTLWSRIGVAGAIAVIWPLLLRRLLRGNTRVYARIRRVSLIAAVAVIAVLFLGTAPAWLHVLQGVQAAALIAVFATTMRPQLRTWYATYRTPPECPGAWRPILLLAVLAPLTAEVSIGNLPFSVTGVLAAVFTVPIYSAGSLLVRELTVRTGGGWPAVLLLGVAYCLLEEGVGLQSIFSPTLYGAPEFGARVAGVNGVFLLLQAVNHAVWSVAVPIALTGLVFPRTRGLRWMQRPGLILTGVLYLAGVGLMVLIHMQADPGFFAPVTVLAGTAVVALLIAFAALRVLPRIARRPRPAPVPAPLTVGVVGVGVVGFVAAAGFLAVLILPQRSQLPLVHGGPGVLVAIVVALAIVAVTGWYVARWSAGSGWRDTHLLALAGGSVLGHSLIWGLVLPTTWATRAGVIVLFVATLAALVLRYRRMTRAGSVTATRPAPVTGAP